MAQPLPSKTQPASPTQLNRNPKTVLAVKEVRLAMVSYNDETGIPQSQLAVIGDNNVHLLNARNMNISNTTTQGQATEWLRDGIFKKLKGE